MKFKVNDWVTTLSGETKQVTGFSEEQGSTIIHSDGFMCYASDCEPWKPKAGEWCWLKTDKSFKLVKYDTPTFNQAYYHRLNPTVEPFIGELPSFLKETL